MVVAPAAEIRCCCVARKEVPVMAWPGDQRAAAAGGRGRLRASHADRERSVEVLKNAFVQGRLTKPELDARVGQALASRTYAELAALTADIPAGSAAAPSPGPVRARARRQPNTAVKRGARVMTAITVLTAGVWAAALASPVASPALARLVVTCTVVWFGIMLLVGAVMLDSWQDKRSGRQLPPRRTLDPGVH
jgi:Domain of unknown function (DUF1707)